MSRMSLRARLTLAFAAGMTLVSLAVASFVYVQMRSDLRSEVDMGLRARAQALITEPNVVRGIPQSSGHLADNDESFAQVLDGDGRILAATRSVAREPLLRRTDLRHDQPWLTDRRPPGLETARLLEVPATVRGVRVYLVVGATLSDTREALTRLLQPTEPPRRGQRTELTISAERLGILGQELRPLRLQPRDALAGTHRRGRSPRTAVAAAARRCRTASMPGTCARHLVAEVGIDLPLDGALGDAP